MKPVGETEFVNGVAAMSASGRYGQIRAAPASSASPTSRSGPRVGEVLDAHMAVGARFKGIRHAAGWDASDEVRNSHTNPTEGLLLDATFRKGFRELGKRGLSFDAWLYHPQIPQLTDLARAFPGHDDHRRPLRRTARHRSLRRQARGSVRAVEEVVRGSREVSERRREDRRHRDADQRFRFPQARRVPRRPTNSLRRAATTIGTRSMCFGPDRCMFESNFPVDKASCSYRTLWNSFKKIAAGASAAEKAALFHDTAARVYRL